MNKLLLRKKLAGGKGIPNLPKQAHRLLLAFSNDAIEYRDLVKIIEDHPTIAARLIALANSAWASPATPVNSLERACVHLGLTIVRSVSIGLTLISPFNSSACPAFDIRRFWISSKLVADGAVLLASALPAQPQSSFMQTLHTGGLLHNIGLICLADLMPRETHLALLSVNSTPELPVKAALYQTIQTDFCEVGGLLAEAWGLPDDLAAVIRFHCDADYPADHWMLIALVGDAAVMVSALFRNQPEFPALSSAEKLGISQADQQQVFNQLQPLFLEANELARDLF